MRKIEEIRLNWRVKIEQVSDDGFNALISMPRWTGSLVCSWGAGWEHVSVAPFARRLTPSWDDMCLIKEIFWKDEEAVIQIHPPKAEYVNNVPNCLHLWRCAYKPMVLPPSAMVGIRKGQTMQEIEREIGEAYSTAEKDRTAALRKRLGV